MNFKKFASIMMMLILAIGLVACNNGEESTDTSQENGSEFDNSAPITVVSREDGSGTRGAFTEITGILAEENGEEIDKTTVEAMIQNSTNGVMTAVSGDPNGIGYISLGSVNDSIKVLNVEDVVANPEDVKDGSYKLARPFNVAWSEESIGEIGQDLLEFIHSDQGQKIVEEEGYISVGEMNPYEASNLEGNITVAGSTSVTPVMEKLTEAYIALNPNVQIDIQSTGSSAGMTSAMEGSANLGMASRELKDEELAVLSSTEIAIDGIAVIVNNENPLENLTMEQIRQIFTGEIVEWSEIQ